MDAEKKSFWTFIFIICELHLAIGQVELTHNSTSALTDTFICGTNTKFTCKIDPAPILMSWIKDSTSQTSCQGATDSCFDAAKDNYQFTSDFAAKEYYLTVNPVKLSNAGTFTCSNGASVDDSRTISIAEVPSAITMTQESGTGTITVEATTDCSFPMSDVSIEWYYLEELTDTPKLYTGNGFSPVRTEDSSTCTSGDCTSGAGVSKVISTVTFVEKESGTSAYLQAKMVHSAAPSGSPAVVAITTNKYIIIEASTDEIYDCPGLGNSTAVDSEDKCASAWFGICCAILLVLFLIGICCGCLWICTTCCCTCFYTGTGCKDCVNNYYCSCKCFTCTPCGACCNIKGLPSWYQGLWASIIGIPIALGILLVWRCCNNEERQVLRRPQPPLPAEANSNPREGSGSVVSRQDVEMQETDTSFKRSQSPNKRDRANSKDDDHLMLRFNTPAQKAGALESITDSAREEVTKKKKKKKRRVETEDD